MISAKFLSLVCLIVVSLGSTVEQADVSLVHYVEDPQVHVDGRVHRNEYSSNFTDSTTNITVYWEHNGTDFFIALKNGLDGWLAIGFGPKNTGMDGADMIIGYIEENHSVLSDEIGVGRMHFSDVSRGGEDDVKAFAGTYTNDSQVLEFIIPLISGDSLDQRFNINGTYGFFFAYQASSKDINIIHTGYSQTYLLRIAPTAKQTTSNEPNTTITLIVVGVLVSLVVIGAVIKVVKRPKVYRFSDMKRQSNNHLAKRCLMIILFNCAIELPGSIRKA